MINSGFNPILTTKISIYKYQIDNSNTLTLFPSSSNYDSLTTVIMYLPQM